MREYPGIENSFRGMGSEVDTGPEHFRSWGLSLKISCFPSRSQSQIFQNLCPTSSPENPTSGWDIPAICHLCFVFVFSESRIPHQQWQDSKIGWLYEQRRSTHCYGVHDDNLQKRSFKIFIQKDSVRKFQYRYRKSSTPRSSIRYSRTFADP